MAKKTEDLKIKDEQLAKIQAFVKQINNMQLTIGQVETQKQTVMNQLFVVQQELTKFQNELKDEYGNVSINIETGTIKEIEDEPANKED